MKRIFLFLAAAAIVLGTRLETASACGGLFCNAASPVVQNSERIIFVDNGNGTITAVIEIVYQGPVTNFSWVLPVSGVPAIEVASTTLMPAIAAQTQPTITPTSAGTSCQSNDGCSGCACGAGSEGRGVYYSDADAGISPGVMVVGSGNAGPYDYVVISVDAGQANQADTARAWLMTNGYNVSNTGADVLGAYLDGGQNLVAFRLASGATSGSIRPIVMTYASTLGVIPIRPTAVAALNDLGVLVFMFGGSRAVPVTYDEIELSDAAIDWTLTTPYSTVVGDAIDEAGGHAFITEFAGTLPRSIDLGADAARTTLDTARANAALDGWQLVSTIVDAFRFDTSASGSFGPFDGLVDALVEGVPTFTASSAASYISFQTNTSGAIVGFDRTVFLDAVERFVVEPREVSEDIVTRRPYVTRLFTTIDPVEMTIDPVFAFATGLPTVTSNRSATLTTACVRQSTTNVQITLADGTAFDPRRLDLATPKVLRRIDYDLDGSHVVTTDNSAAIAAALHDARARTSSSCAMDEGTAAGALLQRALFVLALVVLVRRMRPVRA